LYPAPGLGPALPTSPASQLRHLDATQVTPDLNGISELHFKAWNHAPTPELQALRPRAGAQTVAAKLAVPLSKKQMDANWDAI
jgi:hypothetical protein